MYTKEEIITKIKEVHLNDLYKAPCINYAGTSNKVLYTETVSQYIIENITLNDISTLSRLKGYKTPSHFNKSGKIKLEFNKTNRLEEIEAKELINSAIEIRNQNSELGRLIDYQIPLKNVKTDYGLGKVDLLSESANSLYLIELKNSKSKETLLRCMLEIETYYQTIDKKILLESYDAVGKTVKKAILIFEGTRPYEEFKDLGNRPYLSTLLDKLQIDIFVISKTNSYKNE